MKRVLVGVAAVAALAGAATADVVTDWNNAMLDAIKVTGINPPMASRAMAMTQTAVFDAVNAFSSRYDAYAVSLTPDSGASRDAAAAAAAHRVLTTLFPSQAAVLDAKLASSLSGINSKAAAKGLAHGQATADAILALRSSDGSGNSVVYIPGTDPGEWRPTPPGFLPALLPHWGQVDTFGVPNGETFRPGPPPALTSAEYTAAYNEVKELGSLTSATRTAEQTEIALMWAAGPGTVTPPGQWNQIAQQAASVMGNGSLKNARMFAMLGTALADSAITAWNTKYEYNYWRPVAGIREGDTDGNPDTIADAAWTPLITTPPFPAYTSGHSTFSASGAAILAAFFGSADIDFEVSAVSITRQFDNFFEAAEEAGQSRIYGGIHWQFDNTAGLDSGYAIGDYIAANYFQHVPTPGALGVLGLGGILAARRRRA